jgi:hypothetical protein
VDIIDPPAAIRADQREARAVIIVIGPFGDTLCERPFAFRTLASEWATTHPESLDPLDANEW